MLKIDCMVDLLLNLVDNHKDFILQCTSFLLLSSLGSFYIVFDSLYSIKLELVPLVKVFDILEP
jgi:hypothetical protein